MKENRLDSKFLVEMAHYKMPFGKYKDRYLIDLPEAYLTWFHQKGFPNGKLGVMLQSVYEIKINGLEGLVRGIQQKYPLQKKSKL